MDWRRSCAGLTLLFATGCNMLSYPLAVMASEQTEKIPAEFNKLDGKKAAVVVWAQPETMLQFPHMRLELASQVTYQMKQRLETTQVVSAEQIADYQDRNLNWDALPPTQIGKQFGADYVVFIELLEYSTRDPKTPACSAAGRRRRSWCTMWLTRPPAGAWLRQRRSTPTASPSWPTPTTRPFTTS